MVSPPRAGFDHQVSIQDLCRGSLPWLPKAGTGASLYKTAPGQSSFFTITLLKPAAILSGHGSAVPLPCVLAACGHYEMDG